jgi:hypothetical protein
MAARKVVLLPVKLESQSQTATGSDSRINGNEHHMYLKPERTCAHKCGLVSPAY